MINYLSLPCISHSVLSQLHLSTKVTTNTSQHKWSSVLIHNPKTYVKVNHLPSPTLVAPFQASSIGGGCFINWTCKLEQILAIALLSFISKKNEEITDGSTQEKKNVVISYLSSFIPFIIHSNINQRDMGPVNWIKSKEKQKNIKGTKVMFW